MLDLIVGFVVEVFEEAWGWAKELAYWAALLGLLFGVPLAVGFLAWAKILSLRPAAQPFWAAAAVAVGACAWRVWSRRVGRFLATTFGEG